MPQSDGSQKAVEIHIFPEPMRGTGEGHRPWDLMPNSTMTNATITHMVKGVQGNEITLDRRFSCGTRPSTCKRSLSLGG
jgi:hypothetical protein